MAELGLEALIANLKTHNKTYVKNGWDLAEIIFVDESDTIKTILDMRDGVIKRRERCLRAIDEYQGGSYNVDNSEEINAIKIAYPSSEKNWGAIVFFWDNPSQKGTSSEIQLLDPDLRARYR